MNAELKEVGKEIARETAKYGATYGIGFGVGTLIPIDGMRYQELGHIIGGGLTLLRAYLTGREKK